MRKPGTSYKKSLLWLYWPDGTLTPSKKEAAVVVSGNVLRQEFYIHAEKPKVVIKWKWCKRGVNC